MNVKLLTTARVGLGFLQGLALYAFYKAAEHGVWPATHALTFVPIEMITLIVPVLISISLGQMRGRALAAWIAGASLILAALSAHDVLRRGVQDVRVSGAWSGSGLWSHVQNVWQITPSLGLFFLVLFGLFIAQSLVMAAEADRRPIASYPRYFDVAWKLAIQVNFSIVFTCLFWLALSSGSGLFMLIKITWMADLIKHDWFDFPATTTAFAYGLHLTDVRASMVRGIRTLKLTLMSWLLPIMTGFVAIFLIGIPFKGMDLLWATHHTSQILLGTAIWMIMLINAAYQDGSPEHRPGNVLRLSGTVACGLLLPLVVLAIYALILRVGEHGWTVHMIDVFFCLAITACYAVGYFWAACDRGGWLARIEKTNIYTSFAIICVLVAVLTPIADPARLAVADQVARLRSGKVSAENFDYAYLKNSGEVYGTRALEKLKTDATGADAGTIKENADARLTQNPLGPRVQPQADLARSVTVYPQGKKLPDSFIKKDWSKNLPQNGAYPRCLFDKNIKCDAYIVDAAADQPQRIIVANVIAGPAYLFQASGEDWQPIGPLTNLIDCRDVRDALRAGKYKMQPSTEQELVVNGLHIRTRPNEICPAVD